MWWILKHISCSFLTGAKKWTAASFLLSWLHPYCRLSHKLWTKIYLSSLKLLLPKYFITRTEKQTNTSSETTVYLDKPCTLVKTYAIHMKKESSLSISYISSMLVTFLTLGELVYICKCENMREFGALYLILM